MRFLVFMIPAVYQPKDGKQQNPDFKQDPKKMARMMAAMGRFNDEVQKATKVHSIDGLAPLAKGARLAFAGGKPTVTDGPAIDSKEVVGGYWLIDAKNKQQVVDWWKRCPAEDGDVIEIRQVAEMSDFPPELQKALKEQGAGSLEQEPAVAEAMAGKSAAKPQRSATRAPHSATGAPGPWKKPKGSRTKDQD
jgi:hypothetical protein